MRIRASFKKDGRKRPPGFKIGNQPLPAGKGKLLLRRGEREERCARVMNKNNRTPGC
jgi:hypothetical protein